MKRSDTSVKCTGTFPDGTLCPEKKTCLRLKENTPRNSQKILFGEFPGKWKKAGKGEVFQCLEYIDLCGRPLPIDPPIPLPDTSSQGTLF